MDQIELGVIKILGLICRSRLALKYSLKYYPNSVRIKMLKFGLIHS